MNSGEKEEGGDWLISVKVGVMLDEYRDLVVALWSYPLSREACIL